MTASAEGVEAITARPETAVTVAAVNDGTNASSLRSTRHLDVLSTRGWPRVAADGSESSLRVQAATVGAAKAVRASSELELRVMLAMSNGTRR